ncbi:MAG: ABC transporter permease [Rhodobacteraceae bacterium]|nr:ABC transporter permease [Paracoccaceae bacterium]
MRILLRRLGFYLAAFAIAVTLNFFIPRMMPGDPLTRLMAAFKGKLTESQLAGLRQTYGYDGSLGYQFWVYIKNLAHLDFGVSTMTYPDPTSDLLFYAAGWTLFLVGIATALSFGIGILMGIYSAWHRGGWFDSIFTPVNVMFTSFTPAIVALILYYGLALKWQIFPLGRAETSGIPPGWTLDYAKDVAWHAVLPVLSIVIVNYGSWHLGMRNSIITLLNEDFVIMARAKGLDDRRIRNRYVARNAMLPQVASLALSVGYVLGGALITEVVFNYPGLGKFSLSAIEARDYSFIAGQMILLTASVLIANLLSDVVNVILDPRLRSRGHS